ncbi:conserved Plasmodium protein, unknown function [Plasmodium ovale wallikeri]|uniref:Uncharacterized protein n=1 Tax=Plasmodium ovale wallikeri TaxID=864142 RepID=A0A1A8ZPF1_PLAOA|nr:conserved Plasmodium protein, unknown function [Plasmodium ovale wallikeri]
MNSKFDINNLNKDTILLKTRKLKKLCENEGSVNNQHLNTLIDVLTCFFEKYNDCILSSVVWEVVDKIILLENTIEEGKGIDVDLDSSIRFCEFVFSKIVCYANYENDNLAYFFSFNCLRRHLCSVISSFLNFNTSSARRKIESSFSSQLINITEKIFEKIKIENDLELKVSYTEFLWRSFRRIDLSTFDIKRFRVDIETFQKLKNLKILKFDEECINWLKEENYMDGKSIIENGKCSVLLYYDNEEEDEKSKIEIPYYHISKIYFKNKNLFVLDCKAIVNETNLFCLWGEDIKNHIDHETINKFTLSLDVRKGSKEIRKDLHKLLDRVNSKLKKEAKNEAVWDEKLGTKWGEKLESKWNAKGDSKWDNQSDTQRSAKKNTKEDLRKNERDSIQMNFHNKKYKKEDKIDFSDFSVILK